MTELPAGRKTEEDNIYKKNKIKLPLAYRFYDKGGRDCRNGELHFLTFLSGSHEGDRELNSQCTTLLWRRQTR